MLHPGRTCNHCFLKIELSPPHDTHAPRTFETELMISKSPSTMEIAIAGSIAKHSFESFVFAQNLCPTRHHQTNCTPCMATCASPQGPRAPMYNSTQASRNRICAVAACAPYLLPSSSRMRSRRKHTSSKVGRCLGSSCKHCSASAT